MRVVVIEKKTLDDIIVIDGKGAVSSQRSNKAMMLQESIDKGTRKEEQRSSNKEDIRQQRNNKVGNVCINKHDQQKYAKENKKNSMS